LDQLAKPGLDGNRFARRVDMGRVGAFGHSFGGAAALQAAKDDRRISAAIDLDGTLYGAVAHTGLAKPVMLIKHWPEIIGRPPGREAIVDGATVRDGRPGYLLFLQGSTHETFSDYPAVLAHLGASMPDRRASINPTRALIVLNAYIGAFFQQYLQDKPAPLLAGPSPEYPEVTFLLGQ
jgi:dienelactone hydrolase